MGLQYIHVSTYPYIHPVDTKKPAIWHGVINFKAKKHIFPLNEKGFL
jgi:hypothetical protein